MNDLRIITRQLLSSFVVTVLVLMGIGCGATKEYNIRANKVASGADATISVSADDAGNRNLSMAVEHLPPPNTLDSKGKHYVVWVIPQRGEAKLLGIMEFDREDREGILKAKTPFKDFQVLMTMETGPRPNEPSDTEIFRQRIST